jgi:cytoplasmic iron level regulating protein YaaA (DUF328/UPF0246 family)
MKLPNNTKKWETRATLNTFKIMSPTKKKDEVLEYQIGQDWKPHMYQEQEAIFEFSGFRN